MSREKLSSDGGMFLILPRNFRNVKNFYTKIDCNKMLWLMLIAQISYKIEALQKFT